jgi:alkylation response protein AidB-like acyl-CoA dehydrogenase
MDFRDSPADAAFRQEIIDFLKKEWPGMGAGDPAVESDEEYRIERTFEKKLAAKGWLTAAWPVEYGGQGQSIVRQSIMKEECSYFRAPIGGGPGGQATGLVGPAIMAHGTPEQKMRFLPPISRGDVMWCQGFSEVNAGSDLANIETRAESRPDGFVINGRKIWTSGALYADWCHVLVRTDPNAPKHKGISYLLVDLKTPGISFRSIPQMTGREGFYETTFENVFVPRENMLGQENRGWYAANTTLNFERSGAHRVGWARRHFDELIQYIKERPAGTVSPAIHKKQRIVMANHAVEIGVARWIAYRVSEMQDRGVPVIYESSLSKAYGTEIYQRLSHTGMNILGMGGQRRIFSPGAPIDGRMCHLYLQAVHFTVSAGSNEIQRNVVAQRGLGLPKD